jgi:hypothetical protein
MPDSYAILDSQNGLYVANYTSSTNYTEVDETGIIPTRTQTQCEVIISALNAIAGNSGRFGIHSHPH